MILFRYSAQRVRATPSRSDLVASLGAVLASTLAVSCGDPPEQHEFGSAELIRFEAEESTVSDCSFEVPGGFTNTGLTWDKNSEMFVVSNFLTGSLVWVTSAGVQGSELATDLGPDTLQGVTFGESGAIYASDHYAQEVVLLESSTHGLVSTTLLDLDYRPNGLDYHQGQLWVAKSGTNTLRRYSVETGELEEILVFDGVSEVDGVDYDEVTDTLWVTFDGDGTGIAQIDASTGAPMANIEGPGLEPEGIVVRREVPGELTLWVNNDAFHHGKTEQGNRLYRWQPAGRCQRETGGFFESGVSG